ncbi:MAG: response regulator transcription factor [Clostridia bacterium]|nr:response regulator transcription factor [Clostridia bacterium]
MYRIYIVEDDDGIAGAVRSQLEMWGYEAKRCDDYKNVIAGIAGFDPHIVLLDIGLPFFDGYKWCSELRKTSNVPVIFISSASDSLNIVMAMNMGGDDFIAKPFDMSVLIAKIQAMLRRTYDFADTRPPLSVRGASLPEDGGCLEYDGQRIELSKNEYRILSVLMRSAGKTVSREKLMEALWQTDSYIDDNTLTVNVNRLRKKLDGAGLYDFIETKFGVGYLVRDDK